MADHVQNLDALYAENLADINLKVHTISLYHEQLLTNLKSGLQDALLLVQDDMKMVMSKFEACQPRGYLSHNARSQYDYSHLLLRTLHLTHVISVTMCFQVM